MITAAQLIAVGIKPVVADNFAEDLQRACDIYAINTQARRAAFVAQCAVESMNFTALEEALSYRTPDRILQVFQRLRPLPMTRTTRMVRNPEALANAAYANVNGNGDEASGDGWKYRGRGLIQLTGRTNYAHAGDGLSRPYIDQPDLVMHPEDACLTAGWFWSTHDLNEFADVSDIDGITRRINGPAMREAALRRDMFTRAMAAFA